jgi:hypothetical protein
MNSENIKKVTNQAIEQLITALNEGQSETLRNYLGAIGRFHRYSLRNVMLIASQNPRATHVAGFHTWHKLNRLAYEKFYNTLTVVASGAFVLSVTYLGYLKAAARTPVDFLLLKSSWASLLLCLAGSIFYHNFNTAHYHFGRSREYAAKKKAHRQAVLDEMDSTTVIDEKGVKWTTSDLRLSLVNEINELDADLKWNKRREDLYSELYTWAGRVAQATLGLGIVLLFLFAIANT